MIFINRNSHTGFRSVPRSATLSDLAEPNGCRYRRFILHNRPTPAFGVNCVKFIGVRPILSATKMWRRKSSFWQYMYMVNGDDARCHCASRASCGRWLSMPYSIQSTYAYCLNVSFVPTSVEGFFAKWFVDASTLQSV